MCNIAIDIGGAGDHEGDGVHALPCKSGDRSLLQIQPPLAGLSITQPSVSLTMSATT